MLSSFHPELQFKDTESEIKNKINNFLSEQRVQIRNNIGFNV